MNISQDLCCWYTSKHTLRDCWRAAFSSPLQFPSCISGLYTCAQQIFYYFFSPHLHLSCPYSLTLLFNPHGGLLCLAYVLRGSLFNTRCPSGVTFPGKHDDQHISMSAFVTTLTKGRLHRPTALFMWYPPCLQSLSRPCLLEICLLSVFMWTLLIKCFKVSVAKGSLNWKQMNALWVTDCVRWGICLNSACLCGVTVQICNTKGLKLVFKGKEKLSKSKTTENGWSR